MGKRAKEHRKKVQRRNQRLLIERTKLEKEYQKMIEIKTEELKEKFNQIVQEGIEEKQNQVEDAVIVEEIDDNKEIAE